MVDVDQNFMDTQREVQSTEEGGEGGEVEEHVWGRERVGWFDLVVGGSPLYPGFPAAGWGERLVSSGAAEKCQSTRRGDRRSYGNKTNSEWAEASYSRYTIKKKNRDTHHENINWVP